jgi:hypothetical protein
MSDVAVSQPPTADQRFANLLGNTRGAKQAPDVILVEDLRGGMGFGVEAVFATHDARLAEEVAAVHRRAANERLVIRVRTVPHWEFERLSEQRDSGPGPLDRIRSAGDEAAIMGVSWPPPS